MKYKIDQNTFVMSTGGFSYQYTYKVWRVLGTNKHTKKIEYIGDWHRTFEDADLEMKRLIKT
mgnify:CR=1 FL=1